MPESAIKNSGPSLNTLAPFAFRPMSNQGQKIDGRPMGSYIFAYPTPQKNPDMSRLYVPGDPLKYIDWKAFGRTDQLLIRSKKEEVNATVYIGLDGSPSMLWPEADTPSLKPTESKLGIAFRVACHLASLHVYNGDRVCLVFFKEGDSLGTGRYIELKSLSQIYDIFSLGSSDPHIIKTLFSTEKVFSLSSYDMGYWVGDAIELSFGLEFLRLARKGVFFQALSSLDLDHAWLKKNDGYAAVADAKAAKYSGADLLEKQNCLKQINSWIQQIASEAKSSRKMHYLLTDMTLQSLYFQVLMDLAIIRRAVW